MGGKYLAVPQYLVNFPNGDRLRIDAASEQEAKAKAKRIAFLHKGKPAIHKETLAKCGAWNVWAGSCTLAKGHAGPHVDKYGEAFRATPNRKPRG